MILQTRSIGCPESWAFAESHFHVFPYIQEQKHHYKQVHYDLLFFMSCASFSSWFIFNKSLVNWSITIQYSLTSICFNYPVSPDLQIYYLACINEYTSFFTECVPTFCKKSPQKMSIMCVSRHFKIPSTESAGSKFELFCCSQFLMASPTSLGDGLQCRRD